MKLSDIARALSAEVIGDGTVDVTRLVHPADAVGRSDLALALSTEATSAVPGTLAGAIVARPDAKPPAGTPLIAYKGHERMALAILTRLFDPGPARGAGVDINAAVGADAKIAESASIGPFAAIGPRSAIGAGSIILAGASIGADASIGRDCIIHSGARIGDRVRLGDRVVIQANAVIGSDGYAFIPVRNPDGSRNPIETPTRIHSLATVMVGDDVEIGAGTTIDRGTLRDTRIGRGTKIDNQVQVAHNVVIGENCIVCGMVGIAGSATIGDRVILAAGAGVGDHVTVGSDATLTALAAAGSDVPAGEVFDGIPALPRRQAAERFMNIGRLKTLYPRVDELRKRLEALEKDGKGG
jgi:UDP-3-O-[3-hydroxymyristoyl] glucosamine N-acyltransferase